MPGLVWFTRRALTDYRMTATLRILLLSIHTPCLHILLKIQNTTSAIKITNTIGFG